MKIGIGLPASIPGVSGDVVLEWARQADSGPSKGYWGFGSNNQGYVNTERGSVENLAIAETEARITSLEPQLATKNQQTDHLHHLLARSPLTTFVMKALARIPSAGGIAAMQSINVVVINPWFMGAFFGTALACLVLVVSSLFRLNESSAIYLLIGSLLYLIGTIAVTMVFNVPRNDALAAADPECADGGKLWDGYVASWTRWNHVRTAAALAAYSKSPRLNYLS